MKSGPILYEVRVSVSDDQAAAFERYMTETHIDEVVVTNCFISATFSKNAAGEYRTSYTSVDRSAFDRYLSEHAERLRADFAENFPSGISVEREEWSVIYQIGF